MSTSTRRQRTATTASVPPDTMHAAVDLQELVSALSDACTPDEPSMAAAAAATSGGGSYYPDLANVTQHVVALRTHLVAAPDPPRCKDDFRRAHGFPALLRALRTYSGFYHPARRTADEKRRLFALLEALLDLLAHVCADHYGNRRFFRLKVEGGGWAALEQALASTGLGGSVSDVSGEVALLGKLLAFAVDDKALDGICRDVAATCAKEAAVAGTEAPEAEDVRRQKQQQLVESLEGKLDAVLTQTTRLCNPEIVTTMIDFWKTNPKPPDGSLHPASAILLLALLKVSRLSPYNLTRLHATGILSELIPLMISAEGSSDAVEYRLLHALCAQLLRHGVLQLGDAEKLVCSKSEGTMDLILDTLRAAPEPAHLHFDMSLHGYASVELPSLAKSFPPASGQTGYSFMAWVRIDNFDPRSHTTIFGAFDSSQTCFILAYIEKDTHNLILQTSVTSARPSVRFRMATFEEHKWYHITIVHRRPRPLSSSRATLFVNGEMVEQVKCQYPDSPPLFQGSMESFVSFNASQNKHNPVQVFLGTPQDLSSRLGKDQTSSRWSLASAHLFDELLSDDLIAVYNQLGPRYNGKFQDRLGSFQTYEASTALGMRNEQLYPGKDDASDIFRAIQGKAGNLLAESRIVFAVLPSAMLADHSPPQEAHLYLINHLGRAASNNLYQLTHNNGSFLAINAAIPCINDALTRTTGTATLSGDPVIVLPRTLDDALWRLAGFTSIALKKVEEATDPEAFLKAVEILFLGVKHNWRNSEAMERDSGFSVLAALLRSKLAAGPSSSGLGSGAMDNKIWSKETRDKTSFQLLSLILESVGYQHGNPEDSTIVNPLAYRALLVDCEIWRKTSLMTQEMYYKQFITFTVKSRYQQFNIKRLNRMRIVKRFIDILKADVFTRDTFALFLGAFAALFRCSMTPEICRALATFITYAMQTPPAPTSKTPGSQIGTPLGRARTFPSAIKQSTTAAPSAAQCTTLTRKELGTKVLEMYANIVCQKGSTVNVERFARTVTSKWLLHLLTEDDLEIALHCTKIIARLLATLGPSYVNKFASTKTRGFIIMRRRLRRWWDVPAIWPILFSIMFNHDVADINFDRPFDLFMLLETFDKDKVVNPGILPVITALMQHGLRDVFRHQDDPESPLSPRIADTHRAPWLTNKGTPRIESMSLSTEMQFRASNQSKHQRLTGQAMVLQTVVRFLGDLHAKSPDFRNFAYTSEYVRHLLVVLYPVIVDSDTLSPEVELNSREAISSLDVDDIMIGASSHSIQPRIGQTTIDTPLPPSPTVQHAKPRPASSFILLTARPSDFSPSAARLKLFMSPAKKIEAHKPSNIITQGLMDIVVNVFIDQVMHRKDFSGFGLFLKVPPGFQEHQVFFESLLLRNTLQQLANTISLDKSTLQEPKLLQNLARFVTQMGEAVYEGWFLDGAEALIDFAGQVLEYVQRPDIAQTKNVRLCTQAVLTIRNVFLRVVLLRFSELQNDQVAEETILAYMHKLQYWQATILTSHSGEEMHLKLLCYHLYIKLVDRQQKICLAAADMWRIMLIQKPEETASMLEHAVSDDQRKLHQGFRMLMEIDNEAFFAWLEEQRDALDALFFGAMSKAWDDFVKAENEKTAETARNRIAKRRDRLRTWQAEVLEDDGVLFRHDVASGLWRKNIYAAEHEKHQRAQQDQQDDLAFVSGILAKMHADVHRPCAVADSDGSQRWKLDRTEGRSRMRLRMLPDREPALFKYQPKRRVNGSKMTPKVTAAAPPGDSPVAQSPALSGPDGMDGANEDPIAVRDGEDGMHDPSGERLIPEEEFELVDGPNGLNDAEDVWEDKMRRVLRSMQRGDTVQHVYNVSRIIGLDACEGLLLFGKNQLYLVDNVFVRQDSEIVHIDQAPLDERDPYLRMISGRRDGDDQPRLHGTEQESRSWKWHEIISISKRRFLFRDVAVEVFFTDGRSYLLTAKSPVIRNEVHAKLCSKAPQSTGSSAMHVPEDAWRLDALKITEEPPSSFGSKFGSIFNSSAWNPAMRRWAKGEISNFHYLMLVNTMAGRTFNDLTQYPVFPWVLSDYTSEELDLKNPASFRDLSKPMGAQNMARQSEYMSRYTALAEMNQTEPPFHYGTHYSTAMIVTSYLIRLQPFVQSYLLLQGGSFDFPDRMFYSIEKAWTSAARDNMSDVRELIPEFFYLPEFLTNNNHFDFGQRQGSGGSIDDVVLPPWAKGDPKIFIAKHREALESPYVSQHLHRWIDLVFGAKQRGEAAVENVNVFHYLSYHGAKDLDTIDDPNDKLSTIGIIHNFGQTPLQVFSKPHQAREFSSRTPANLDTGARALAQQPIKLFENHDRIASLIYSTRLDRLLPASARKLVLPPHYDKQIEWGFADCSVRCYFTESRKLAGIFENLHQGQLSTALLASSNLLMTAGEDCVVSAHTLTTPPSKTMEVVTSTSLFGHRTPVTTLAVSRSFAAMLSASTDGMVLLWDLNRFEFVRKLAMGRPLSCAAISDVSGDILLCRGQKAHLLTLNADPILEQNVCNDVDDTIVSCAFYEGIGNEWLENTLIFTGHTRGVVNIWRKTVSRLGNWVLELVRRLDHVDSKVVGSVGAPVAATTRAEAVKNIDAGITCIRPMPRCVFTGDEDGRVYEWAMVQRDR